MAGFFDGEGYIGASGAPGRRTIEMSIGQASTDTVPVTLARVHGVHRSWLYKLLGRYRADGDAGRVLRSRRPHRSPIAGRAGFEPAEPASTGSEV